MQACAHGENFHASHAMLRFAEQALKDRFHVGAIFPSGPRLARALTQPMRGSIKPKRVLEVGPGTGPVTRAILATLRDGDSFTAVEVNQAFAKQLDEKLLQPFRERNPNITVTLINKPIQDAGLIGPFHFIICGVPFNNFPPALVRTIFRTMLGVLAPDGDLTFFEYLGMRPLRTISSSRKGRKNVRSLHAINEVLKKRYHGDRIVVFRNIPPAAAVRLRNRTASVFHGEPGVTEPKTNGKRARQAV
jgi:phospholipid N-methyltransferase